MGALLEVLVGAKALLVTSHVAIGLAAGLRLAVDDEAVLDVLVLRSVRDRLALLGVLVGAKALLVTIHVAIGLAVGLRLAVDDEAVKLVSSNNFWPWFMMRMILRLLEHLQNFMKNRQN